MDGKEKERRKIVVLNSGNLHLQVNKFEGPQEERVGKRIYLKEVLYFKV